MQNGVEAENNCCNRHVNVKPALAAETAPPLQLWPLQVDDESLAQVIEKLSCAPTLLAAMSTTF